MSANLPPMTWWAYVRKVTGGATQTAVAERVNISGPAVTRWRNSSPKPENAAAFARAYGRPVLEAFIYAGYLSAEDAETQLTLETPGGLTDEELVEELLARLRRTRGGFAHPLESSMPSGSFRSGTAFAPLTDAEVAESVFVSGLAEDLDEIRAEFEEHLRGAVTKRGMSTESRAQIVEAMTADVFARIRTLATAGAEQKSGAAHTG